MLVQDKDEVISLFNDNRGTIKLVNNDVYHSRTKHIDVRHHFVRNVCDKGVIELRYLCIENMPADVFTKGLSMSKHWKYVSQISMEEINKR